MFDMLRKPLMGKKGFLWGALLIAVDLIHPEIAIVERLFNYLSEHPLLAGGAGLMTLRAGMNNAVKKLLNGDNDE